MENVLSNNMKAYKEGEIIFMEYEIGDRFFFVQNGSVKLTKIVRDVENIIGVVKEGDFFGEMAVLDDAPRSASAIANEDCVLMELHKTNFENLLSGNAVMAFKLIGMFALRIIDTKRKLMIIQLENPEFKVMDCLLLFAENLKIPQDKYVKPQKIKTTVLEIANWCAIKPMVAQKALLLLIQTKYIAVEGDYIVVKNLKEIQKQIDLKRRKY